jgi:hypothetical protein
MKSWRDIAMDCVTLVSKVRAAKVPKSAFGHANRRKSESVTGRKRQQAATRSDFVRLRTSDVPTRS